MDGAVTQNLMEILRSRFADGARFGEPLSRHTSFRIGGPADAWVEASSAEDLRELLGLAADHGLPLVVFGTGTNVLVSDAGVRGIVVKLGRSFGKLEWGDAGDPSRVRAGAAAPFKKLVVAAAARGFGGLEFAEGIPGSIGGGLLMNAGAFGGDISHVVGGITGVDRSGEVRLSRDQLSFGYRRFDLPQGLVVTHIDFVLERGDPAAIHARMAEAKRRRDSTQPLGFPNAGSIFKNPPGHYAGRLIESLGFKGKRVGGAMVSPHHANFIVNTGAATARDVRQLMDEISAAVWREKEVKLVPEIKLIGDWEATC
jgi:UDP-N-acetylmuramate dehydrogenase